VVALTDLDQALAAINSLPNAPADLDTRFDSPSTRLAAYGTLRPGQSNHLLLAEVGGEWVEGIVHGERFMAHGYPAFKWRPGTGEVPVSVLTSATLPAHWARLDAFEGADYRRILVPVKLPDARTLVAYLYEYIPT
jgi:gamma-glutamylcyclotransferase (GGCT)/AIG2-like uncharacterized protein YtfP